METTMGFIIMLWLFVQCQPIVAKMHHIADVIFFSLLMSGVLVVILFVLKWITGVTW